MHYHILLLDAYLEDSELKESIYNLAETLIENNNTVDVVYNLPKIKYKDSEVNNIWVNDYITSDKTNSIAIIPEYQMWSVANNIEQDYIVLVSNIKSMLKGFTDKQFDPYLSDKLKAVWIIDSKPELPEFQNPIVAKLYRENNSDKSVYEEFREIYPELYKFTFRVEDIWR